LKSKIRFYNTIYFRIMFIFGIVFSILLITVGVVFMKIYSENVINDYKEQLYADAEKIADNVEDYSLYDSASEYRDYMNAITALLDNQMVDVWVLPYYKSDNRLKQKYVTVSLRMKDLSKGMKKVVKRSMAEDITLVNRGYDDIYEADLIRVASPVHDAGGNVVGTVLLNGMVGSKMEVINSCKHIILISMLIAWVVAFFVSLLFARQISGPISKIRETTLRLANNEYSAKTGLRRTSGELAELGDTINILSDRLLENEKMRESIEQSRMDFFANVSHELRTPITVVRGYAETLADGYVIDKEKISHSLGRILSECETMERLVEDLLLLSKMQNPDFEINKEPVSVVQIFESVIRSARVLCEKKNIELTFETDDPYQFMLGDYDRLRQMFMVIIDNAIKFSYENSKVEVKLVSGDDNINIHIRDYGIGMSEEVLPNIFDKFYKSKLRMNEKGSGLGLMIARQIAIKHGGVIEVESEENVGSCFSFKFEKIEPPEDV